MSVERPPVGEPLVYRGHRVTATLMGPDLLGYIDGEEMAHFYTDLTALRKVAMRVIDDKIKEQEKRR